jgi:hypothetical protein
MNIVVPKDVHCIEEKEVTASHNNGSSRTPFDNTNEQLSMDDVLSPSVLPNSVTSPKRGFQHVYQSKKTTSSLRVRAAHYATLQNGSPQNRSAIKRDKKKQVKLNNLQEVLPSPAHSRHVSFLKTNRVFFSGTSQRVLPNPHPSSDIILSAPEDLHVIDTVNGARMKSDSGEPVFFFVPREDAIGKATYLKKTLASLHALDRAKTTGEVRGKKRIAVAKGDGKHIMVGLKPSRGCRGISECWPKKFMKEDKDEVAKLMKGCEEVAKGYLPSEELQGL